MSYTSTLHIGSYIASYIGEINTVEEVHDTNVLYMHR